MRRLFGDADPIPDTDRTRRGSRELSPDERAVERYRYLLRTAPPETIEAAHAEAFAQLSPEQRQMVLQELNQVLTSAERSAGVGNDEDPRALARLATRAVMRQPGTLERTWSGMPATAGPGRVGLGNFMMGSFLGTFAGVMLGSMVADAFLGDAGYDQTYADGGESAQAAEGGDMADADMGDGGAFGDFGGDFGGFGDFGGGEF